MVRITAKKSANVNGIFSGFPSELELVNYTTAYLLTDPYLLTIHDRISIISYSFIVSAVHTTSLNRHFQESQ